MTARDVGFPTAFMDAQSLTAERERAGEHSQHLRARRQLGAATSNFVK